jgi:hypothetical protein
MAAASQSTFLKRSTGWIVGLGLATIGGALIAAPAAHANPGQSTPGSDPTAGIASFTNGLKNKSLTNNTYGYSFTTSSALTIKSLGIYDVDFDGLSEGHQVGIWDLNKNLLGSVSIGSGTSATLVNGFRYVNLSSPLTLAATTTYRIGALYAGPGDQFAETATALAGNGITLLTPHYSTPASASLEYPNFQTNVDAGYIGPNFSTESVPVPGPLPLFGAATAFGFSRRLRKRIRSNRSLG